jgi:hypothetical protein
MYDPGQRVRELNTVDGQPGRFGTVLQFIEDTSSCCDPDCCGGPYHQVFVRWDDGEEETTGEYWVEEVEGEQ